MAVHKKRFGPKLMVSLVFYILSVAFLNDLSLIVSEDFVMSLNLATAGYLIRWATYSKSQFLEGVSLSCDDELNRWQK